jgi:hypothetical protein
VANTAQKMPVSTEVIKVGLSKDLSYILLVSASLQPVVCPVATYAPFEEGKGNVLNTA